MSHSPKLFGTAISWMPLTPFSVIQWSRRLEKIHSQAARSLPRTERSWRELDSCMSSDALLMNVFCHPKVLKSGPLTSMLGIEIGEAPEFGFKARVPLRSGRTDRTEVDMKVGGLLLESKLTESDFQIKDTGVVESYRPFISPTMGLVPFIGCAWVIPKLSLSPRSMRPGG